MPDNRDHVSATLDWTVEIQRFAKIGDQKRLIVESLRKVADYIDGIPDHIVVTLLKQSILSGRSTGGMCGAPYEYGDHSSGWKGLWSVKEHKE